MCGILDDALPAIGAVVGGLLTSESGGWGAAIGAGLGGATDSYVQNHNFGDAFKTGAIDAGTAELGSGLAQGLGSLGTAATSSGTAAGSAGSTVGSLGDTAAPELQTLGSSSASGLQGLGNTDIQGMAGSLGGVGGGSAGTGATTGSGAPMGYGGGDANLSTVMGPGNAGAATTGTGSPLTGPTANPSALSSMAQTGSGAPMGYDGGTGSTLEGAQAAGPQSGAGGVQAAMGGYGGDGTTGSGAPMGFGGAGGQATNVAVGGEPSAGLGGMFGTGLNAQDAMNIGKIGLGAYQQYGAQQKANDYANSIKDIYSPTGAYAQQMQQTLARTDAAAGRNSQGGTRAVQLAAALANGQASALGNSNYANAARYNGGANALNGIFNTFSSPQGAQSLQRIGTAGFNGLSSLFGS